jgi:hypothetical protein
MPEKQDVGALVFIFAQIDGQFGIVSTDRKVEAWGQSLDDCWPKYFTKASRAMRKRDREIAAAAKVAGDSTLAAEGGDPRTVGPPLPANVRERKVY